MLRGHRRYVFAVVGWLILSGQAQPVGNNTGRQPGTRQPNASAAQNTQIAAQLSRIGGALETQNNKPESPEEAKRARDDLAAQERMAKWAKWMFWVALAQALLSFVGIVLIYITFKEARRAADSGDAMAKEAAAATRAAMRATREAGDANEIARAGQLTALRPYLYRTNQVVTYHHMRSVDFIADTANVVLYFKNFGQTPARNVKLFARAFIGGIWNGDDTSGLDDVAPVYMGDFPPGHSDSRDGYTAIGLKAKHLDIMGGFASVFVEGQIQYEDGLGRTYWSNFRLASSGEEYAGEKFSYCPTGNTAS